MADPFNYHGLQYFGNAGLITESPGEVVTDIYGLETCTAIYKCPVTRFDIIRSGQLSMFSAHPIFGYLRMERRRVIFDKGFLVTTGEYAGIPGASTEPIYELVVGASEQPIETHPKFITDIAGKPSAPLNGAVFLDENGKLTTDDSKGIFDRFRSTLSGERNQFAGISAYLEAGEITWREIYMSTTRPSDASSVGIIQSPSGNYPSIGSRNWLYFGLNYQQRGIIFSVTREWKASGRAGWNTTIYA